MASVAVHRLAGSAVLRCDSVAETLVGKCKLITTKLESGEDNADDGQ